MQRLPIGPCSDLSTGQRESYEFWPWVLGTRSSCLRKGLGFWHLLQDQAWASGERDCQSHVGLQPETREGRRAEDRHTPLAISSWPWSCNPLQLMSCPHRSIPMQFSNRFGYVIVPSIQGPLLRTLSIAILWTMTNVDRKQAQASHVLRKLRTFKTKQGEDKDLGSELKAQRGRRSLVWCRSQWRLSKERKRSFLRLYEIRKKHNNCVNPTQNRKSDSGQLRWQKTDSFYPCEKTS